MKGFGMHDMKKEAHKDVLKKLIAMAQEAMLHGMGDDEEAGNKIKEAMHGDEDETLADEAHESPAEAKMEEDAGEEPEGLHDEIRREMKRGGKSPLKTGRKVAIMISAKSPAVPAMKAGGRGKY